MGIENFFEEENSSEQELNFDVKRYLRGIYKRKWIVSGIFFLITIPLLLYIKSQPPEYEAYTWIRFKNYNPERLRLLNEDRFTELTSRTFAEKVVAQLGLTIDLIDEDKKNGLMRQDIFSELYTDPNKQSETGKYLLTIKDSTFVIYYLNQDENNRSKIASGKISELIDRSFTFNGITFKLNPNILQKCDEVRFSVKGFRSTVKWFQSRVQVSMGRGGTLMRIQMVHDNPQIVASMVNSLANIFLEESISFEKRNTKLRKQTIKNRLQVAKKDLDRDQESLRQFQKSHPLSLSTDIQNNVTELSALQARQRTIENNKQTVLDFRNKLKDFDKNTITPGQEDSEIRFIFREIVKNLLFAGDATMGILSQQLADAEAERQKLINKGFSVNHRNVVEIDQKIVNIQSHILETSSQLIQKNDVKLRELQSQINSINEEINNLPAEKQRLANLENQVEISQKIYDDLLIQSQELQISDAVETKGISILDPALPPDSPKNTSKKRNAMIGVIFAMFFSLSVAVALELMDKTVKSPDDVKRYLKLDVIGTIPKVEFENEFDLKDGDKLKRIDSQLVTYDYSPTPIGEAYRALRTKIVFSKKTGKIRTLVITSFAAGDGKSFTSANLAVTLAQHKTNTLLIDSDLRRGVLHNTFGLKKEPGFSNYLMNMARLDDIIHETYVPNLTLISCGSMMPNPSELLGSIQLKRFIEDAKRRFDMILFDSPPLNAATDSVVLGTQSDGVVLIARADVTNRNVAKQKLDLFENVPANVIGVILNGTDTELAHDGYSYYHY